MQYIYENEPFGNGTYERYETFAKALGWFSIGLGLAEVIAPNAVADLVGLSRHDRSRSLLRTPVYGMRELAAGVGILSQPQSPAWVWGRVAGDVVDLATLATALSSRDNDRFRLVTAIGAVLGVTALDAMCARRLANGKSAGAIQASYSKRRSGSITINKPREEVYSAWRELTTLPRFMQHLESVQPVSDGRTRWRARGPAGQTVEWEAEIIQDVPNEVLAWRSVPDSDINNSGHVTFEVGPGGSSTIVRVKLDYEPRAGAAGVALAKLFGKEPGQMIEEDLRRFKQILETGEIVASDASIHRGMHPARPMSETDVDVRRSWSANEPNAMHGGLVEENEQVGAGREI